MRKKKSKLRFKVGDDVIFIKSMVKCKVVEVIENHGYGDFIVQKEDGKQLYADGEGLRFPEEIEAEFGVTI